jgi:hypothetical protein
MAIKTALQIKSTNNGYIGISSFEESNNAIVILVIGQAHDANDQTPP